MTIRPGQLTQRVRIERRMSQTNALGEVADSWIPAAESWAAVRTISLREGERDPTVQAGMTHELTMRFGDPVTPATRIVMLTAGVAGGSGHPERVLNVIGVNQDDMARNVLRVQCMEAMNGN